MSAITLPSGLVGEVRGLTGRDGRYLTNEQLVRDNEIEDYIFAHCWTATLDDGPYAFKGQPPEWSRVLVGDRFYMLIAVREETYPGKEYAMKLQCTRMACKKRFEWDISLAKLLAEKTKRLSPEDRQVFLDGNRFAGIIPGTTTPFVFKLKTGADAKRTQLLMTNKKTGPKKQQERQNMIVDALASYIVEIDGVLKKTDAVFDYLEDLSLASLDALMPYIQAHDCGVETDIEVDCPYCGGAMAISLPFDRGFFLPSSSAAKFRSGESSEPEEQEATLPH